MADYGSAAKEGLVDGLQSAAEISLDKTTMEGMTMDTNKTRNRTSKHLIATANYCKLSESVNETLKNAFYPTLSQTFTELEEMLTSNMFYNIPIVKMDDKCVTLILARFQ